MKQHVILVEDTDSMNSAPRLILNSIIQTYLANQSIHTGNRNTVFWNSPGYHRSGPNLSDEFNAVRTCSASQFDDPIIPDDFTCYLKSELASNHDKIITETMSHVRELTSSFLDFEGWDKCISLTWRGIYIGVHCMSAISRWQPKCLITKKIDVQNTLCIQLANIISSCLCLDLIAKHATIDALFLSEHTYIAGAISSYASQKLIPLPLIQYNFLACGTHLSRLYGTPLKTRSIDGMALDFLYSKEPMPLATNTTYLACLANLKKSMLVSGSSTYTSSEAISAVNTFCDELFEAISSKFTKSILTDISSIKGKSLVLYLHAICDGLYIIGYDGYMTSFEYFTDILSCLGDHSEIDNLIIRPHPNMFGPIGSSLDSSQDIVRLERQLSLTKTSEMLNESCQFKNIFIAPPSISLKKLALLSDSVHITHFGTVSLELLYMGVIPIFGQISTYSDILTEGLVW